MSSTEIGPILSALEATIAARAGTDAKESYTASLLAAGPSKCAKKLGEEAVETALAIVSEDKAAVAAESADLLFHLLVALRTRGVTLGEVAGALAARQGVSGHAEKAARQQD
jgi:phosphoribosyl-ATP pyrophosphohydrolase